MLSIRVILILMALVMAASACAPHMKKKHGYCMFYVDGSSDTSSSRKKRDSGSGSGSKEGGGGGGGGGGGKGKDGKFTRTKKKKNTKCYEYEDGTKDEGAMLNEGVTYKVTVKKTS